MKPRQPPRVSGGTVPIPTGNNKPGRCGRRSSGTSATNPGGGFFHGHRCADIARNARPSTPLDARYVCERCFGPLEVALRHEPVKDVGRRRAAASRADPQNIWRYADFLPLEAPPARRGARLARPARRLHAAVARRPARRAPRPAARCGSRTTPPTRRTRSRTASSRSRSPAPASSASRRSPARPPATSRTPSPPTRRRPGWTSLRLHPRRPRGAEDPRHRRLRHATSSPSAATTTTSTGSARSCRPSTSWAFVNVNMRPYYAEGSKTLAYETAEQLGWETPDRVVAPIASGSLFTKIARGLRGVARARADRRATCPSMNGAQAAGCSPVAAPSPAATTSAGRSSPDTIAKSLAIGNPADGPYALDLARRTGGAHRRGHRRRDPRGHPPARRDHRHLHRDRRRRHHGRAGQARRARRHRPRRARRRRTSRARASRRSTRCATRSTSHEVEPSLDVVRGGGRRRP